MDLTRQMIEDNLLNKYTIDDHYDVTTTIQRKFEKEYLNMYRSCPVTVDINDIIEHLSTLNAQELKDALKDNFDSAALLQAISCIITSIKHGNLKVNDTDTYISQLKIFGKNSVNGYAFTASFNGKNKAEDFFVIKAPRKHKDDFVDLTHECFVAFAAINKLREKVPNFAYIYESFNCSAPFIDTHDKDVLSWCDFHKEPVVYAIYENCSPSVSFDDFLNICNERNFMMYFIQLMYALRTAYNECKFTHYDLHMCNVLLRYVSNDPFYIPYDSIDGQIYIKSERFVATIIDFGCSYVEVGGRGYGFNEWDGRRYGIFHDRPYPMYDVYKLLCYSLSSFSSKIFHRLKGLLEFFTNEEPHKFLSFQDRSKFSLPLIPGVTDREGLLDLWIDFCVEYMETIGIDDVVVKTIPPTSKIFTCQGLCKTVDEELIDAGINLHGPLPVPTSFSEFVNVHSHLKSSSAQTRIIKDYTTLFDNSNLYTNEIHYIRNLINKLELFKLYDIPRNFNLVLTFNVLRQTQECTRKCVKYIKTYNKLSQSCMIWKYIKDLYKFPADHLITLKYFQMKDFLDRTAVFKKEIIVHIKDEVFFLEPWRRSKILGGLFGNLLDDNRQKDIKLVRSIMESEYYLDYSWYWTTYPILLSLS